MRYRQHLFDFEKPHSPINSRMVWIRAACGTALSVSVEEAKRVNNLAASQKDVVTCKKCQKRNHK